MKSLCVLLALLSFLPGKQANSKALIESKRAKFDVALSTDPSSRFWRDAQPAFLEVDMQGRPEPEYRTEVRSRWTGKNVYFLFICPYKQLYLKPKPDVTHETNQLWNWNVAEVFLGSDFKDIKHYREFEISPQGEWIDLDVDLKKPHHEDGWVWNSGFEHVARIDQKNHVWYAALKIPFAALESKSPAAGETFRMNLYRTEGPPEAAKEVLWQPTMGKTFHVPEKFGLLKLTE